MEQTILNTLLNLTNLVIQQGQLIEQLNNKVDQLITEKEEQPKYTETKKLSIPRTINNTIINKDFAKTQLIKIFTELNFEVTPPGGRSNPYITLNNNIKIKFSLLRKRGNLLETCIQSSKLNEYHYHIIAFPNDINENLEYLIFKTSEFNFLINSKLNNKVYSDSTLISIVDINGKYFEKRSHKKINAYLNNFDIIK